MGGETEILELQEENASLRSSITELESQLQQSESTKLQLEKSYEEALQTLADSEAKRETVDKELRLAHDQISSMWKELESLRKQVEGGSTHKAEPIPLAQINEHHGMGMEHGRLGSTSSGSSMINESFLELQCTLCKEKINKSVTSLHTITSESTRCTCSHSTTNLASTNLSERNERARSLGAEQRFQIGNGNGTQTQTQSKPSPKGSPKMQQRSRRGSWLFGRKQQQRVQDLESHSKVCSSNSNSKPTPSNSLTASPKMMKKSTSSPSTNRAHSRSNSPLKKSSPRNSDAIVEEYLFINVTRSSHGATDLTPFKVVTKTNLPSFSQPITEVYRSQGDFQWLYEALQEACPERIIPPLKPPISLDATMSEFQRFLSRISTHKILRKQHHFIVFLTGTAEELRSLRAKHRPRRRGDKIQYKPAVGRDTNTGPLVATKDYLTTLEQNINGLVSHLEQSVRRKAGGERTGHWFRAISESEPDETYLKTAAADLSRTCEATECQQSDSDETLFIHNLQSVADYVRASQDLLTRVEEAVDRFLYWDEEITIIEAVTNSPVVENPPAENSEDVVFDDSGVSDVTSSSNHSNSDGHTQSGSHVTSQDSASNVSEEGISTGEKWAQASKHCADSKDYLEMMCRDMAEELAHFDLQKEKELKQVLLEYTAAQLERHEKFRGKWFAMTFLLDTPISSEKRAIQFSNISSAAEEAGDSAEQTSEGTRDGH